jgi:hypothetical protein
MEKALKVALVVDDHNWCFGHMARGIQKFAPAEYDVQVMDATEFSIYTENHPLLLKSFDAVCQFSWPECTHHLPVRNCVVVAHEGVMYSQHSKSWQARMLATDIRNWERAGKVLPDVNAAICFTETLADAVSEIVSEAVVCPPAVDTTIFRPYPRTGPQTVRVGWCGQPTEHKGLVIVNRLREMLPDYQWNVNNRSAGNPLPAGVMAQWHSHNDVFLCTAYSEGGPLTVLEAMACGVPVLSTPVGIVPTIQRGVTLLPAVDEPDDIDRCVRAAHEFLTTQWVREAPDADALAESKRWSWEVNAERWLKAICG